MSQVNSSLMFRPARIEDVDRIAEIEAVSFPCPWSNGLIRQEILRGGPTRFIVAERPSVDQVIGYISYSVAAAELHIINLATHPDYRRQGIARDLLAACMKAGREGGACVVHLEVRESNKPAIQLYNRLKFRQVGHRRRYYTKPVEDALLYSLELGSAPSTQSAESL